MFKKDIKNIRAYNSEIWHIDLDLGICGQQLAGGEQILKKNQSLGFSPDQTGTNDLDPLIMVMIIPIKRIWFLGI